MSPDDLSKIHARSVDRLVDVVREIDKRELLNLSQDDMEEIAWAVAAKAYPRIVVTGMVAA